jgi:hypothetical protein
LRIPKGTKAKENKLIQQLDVPALQDKLRSQKQVVDFLPGQTEQFERVEGGFKEF